MPDEGHSGSPNIQYNEQTLLKVKSGDRFPKVIIWLSVALLEESVIPYEQARANK